MIFDKKIFFLVVKYQKEDFSTNIRNTQLLLTNKNINRSTRQFPTLAHFVFEETLVRFLHVLRQVGKEHERRNLRIGQLSNVFYLDILTFI